MHRQRSICGTKDTKGPCEPTELVAESNRKEPSTDVSSQLYKDHFNAEEQAGSENTGAVRIAVSMLVNGQLAYRDFDFGSCNFNRLSTFLFRGKYDLNRWSPSATRSTFRHAPLSVA